MTKPVALPLALAVALQAAAVLALPKLPPLTVVRDHDGRSVAYAWLTPDVFLMLDVAAVDKLPAGALAASELDARAAEALRLASDDRVTLSAAGLATLAASLPATVPYAAVPSPERVTRTATVVPVAALRALAHGDRAVFARTTTLRQDDGQNRPALVFEGEGWVAIVRGLAKKHPEHDAAPRFDPARPAWLACAGCGYLGGTYETEAEALAWAPRRRWQRRETDEGTVCFCAPCAQASARQAEAV